MTDYTQGTKANASARIRWSWFPSLHFGNGVLPSVIVLTAMILRRYGLNNAQVAFYMSLLCVPFILRPLFEMAVGHFRGTAKVWILSAEFISAMSLWSFAFTLPTAYWLQGTLCFMPFVVVSGIFYNIATSRFYATNPTVEGCRQTNLAMFFRLASMLVCIGIPTMLAGNMEVLTRNVRYSWSFVVYVMAGMEFALWLWHSIFLPGGTHLQQCQPELRGVHRGSYVRAMGCMLRGWRNRFMLCFTMLFMLPCSLSTVVSILFLVDAPHNGGMGLSPQEFGLSFGTIGMMAASAGLFAGKKAIARLGMLKCLLPMALLMSFYGIVLVGMSYNIAMSLAGVCMAVGMLGAASGMGYAACSSMVVRFASDNDGLFRRAMASAIASLTYVSAGMFAGLLQFNVGYRQFFIIVALASAVSVALAVAYMVFRRKLTCNSENNTTFA